MHVMHAYSRGHAGVALNSRSAAEENAYIQTVHSRVHSSYFGNKAVCAHLEIWVSLTQQIASQYNTPKSIGQAIDSTCTAFLPASVASELACQAKSLASLPP
jgi:hypothetical protein